MTQGSVFKRCTCTDSGRRLGARCPKLHRPNGSWNPAHGAWGYQLELPPLAGHRRRQLRRSGFDNRDAAAAERDHARGLLDLAGDDTVLAAQIATMLQDCPYADGRARAAAEADVRPVPCGRDRILA